MIRRYPGAASGLSERVDHTDSVEATESAIARIDRAHVAALMLQHGVGTIYSRDRGFRRFDGIRVVDPFG